MFFPPQVYMAAGMAAQANKQAAAAQTSAAAATRLAELQIGALNSKLGDLARSLSEAQAQSDHEKDELKKEIERLTRELEEQNRRHLEMLANSERSRVYQMQFMSEGLSPIDADKAARDQIELEDQIADLPKLVEALSALIQPQWAPASLDVTWRVEGERLRWALAFVETDLTNRKFLKKGAALRHIKQLPEHFAAAPTPLITSSVSDEAAVLAFVESLHTIEAPRFRPELLDEARISAASEMRASIEGVLTQYCEWRDKVVTLMLSYPVIGLWSAEHHLQDYSEVLRLSRESVAKYVGVLASLSLPAHTDTSHTNPRLGHEIRMIQMGYAGATNWNAKLLLGEALLSGDLATQIGKGQFAAPGVSRQKLIDIAHILGYSSCSLVEDSAQIGEPDSKKLLALEQSARASRDFELLRKVQFALLQRGEHEVTVYYKTYCNSITRRELDFVISDSHATSALWPAIAERVVSEYGLEDAMRIALRALGEGNSTVLAWLTGSMSDADHAVSLKAAVAQSPLTSGQRSYFEGLAAQHDGHLQRAFSLFIDAAQSGVMPAFDAAARLAEELGMHEELRSIVIDGVQNDSPWCLMEMGSILLDAEDAEGAKGFLQRAVELGNSEANLELGHAELSLGNLYEAEQCFVRAREAGNLAACIFLGDFGGTEKDSRAQWSVAAEAGFPLANFRLGLSTCAETPEEAIEHVEEAVRAGLPSAELALIDMHLAAGNFEIAQNLSEIAAESGEMAAISSLGKVLWASNAKDAAISHWRNEIAANNLAALVDMAWALLASENFDALEALRKDKSALALYDFNHKNRVSEFYCALLLGEIGTNRPTKKITQLASDIQRRELSEWPGTAILVSSVIQGEAAVTTPTFRRWLYEQRAMGASEYQFAQFRIKQTLDASQKSAASVPALTAIHRALQRFSRS